MPKHIRKEKKDSKHDEEPNPSWIERHTNPPGHRSGPFKLPWQDLSERIADRIEDSRFYPIIGNAAPHPENRRVHSETPPPPYERHHRDERVHEHSRNHHHSREDKHHRKSHRDGESSDGLKSHHRRRHHSRDRNDGHKSYHHRRHRSRDRHSHSGGPPRYDTPPGVRSAAVVDMYGHTDEHRPQPSSSSSRSHHRTSNSRSHHRHSSSDLARQDSGYNSHRAPSVRLAEEAPKSTPASRRQSDVFRPETFEPEWDSRSVQTSEGSRRWDEIRNLSSRAAPHLTNSGVVVPVRLAQPRTIDHVSDTETARNAEPTRHHSFRPSSLHAGDEPGIHVYTPQSQRGGPMGQAARPEALSSRHYPISVVDAAPLGQVASVPRSEAQQSERSYVRPAERPRFASPTPSSRIKCEEDEEEDAQVRQAMVRSLDPAQNVVPQPLGLVERDKESVSAIQHASQPDRPALVPAEPSTDSRLRDASVDSSIQDIRIKLGQPAEHIGTPLKPLTGVKNESQTPIASRPGLGERAANQAKSPVRASHDDHNRSPAPTLRLRPASPVRIEEVEEHSGPQSEAKKSPLLERVIKMSEQHRDEQAKSERAGNERKRAAEQQKDDEQKHAKEKLENERQAFHQRLEKSNSVAEELRIKEQRIAELEKRLENQQRQQKLKAEQERTERERTERERAAELSRIAAQERQAEEKRSEKQAELAAAGKRLAPTNAAAVIREDVVEHSEGTSGLDLPMKTDGAASQPSEEPARVRWLDLNPPPTFDAPPKNEKQKQRKTRENKERTQMASWEKKREEAERAERAANNGASPSFDKDEVEGDIAQDQPPVIGPNDETALQSTDNTQEDFLPPFSMSKKDKKKQKKDQAEAGATMEVEDVEPEQSPVQDSHLAAPETAPQDAEPTDEWATPGKKKNKVKKGKK